MSRSLYQRYFKRLFDVFFAFTAIILLSPVLLVTAISVRVYLGSPILFKQSRPGKDEKVFNLLKFRSMRNQKDAQGHILSDEERLSNFGKILRASSLDELPSLWNVLKGDMSLIGPRPLLVDYLALYNEDQKKRHKVRPGITGLAQVKGRNAITWEDKFHWDTHYVKQCSFKLDLMILIKTIRIVLKREGISSENSVTQERFKGNLKQKSSPKEGT